MAEINPRYTTDPNAEANRANYLLTFASELIGRMKDDGDAREWLDDYAFHLNQPTRSAALDGLAQATGPLTPEDFA